jgi:hypothetical protein
MNSVCGKVLGDFARSVLHHHRTVTDPDHAIFGNEHGAEQDQGIRPDADRSTHHRGGRHAGAGSTRGVPPCRRQAGTTKNVGPHTLRQAFITDAQVSEIASDASLGSSRYPLPASQRAALRRPQPAGTPRGCGDLGLHGPPDRDASGSSRLHRVHHRQAQRATPGRDRSCEGTRRAWSRHAPDLAASRGFWSWCPAT